MRIISRKKLEDFWLKHPQSRPSLESWYRIVKRSAFTAFSELKTTFPGADTVGKLTVFNIGGNKYRLVAAVHYRGGRVYVRKILSHSEYDKGKWKKD